MYVLSVPSANPRDESAICDMLSAVVGSASRTFTSSRRGLNVRRPGGEGSVRSKPASHGQFVPWLAVMASAAALRTAISAKCDGSMSAAATRAFQRYEHYITEVKPFVRRLRCLQFGPLSSGGRWNWPFGLDRFSSSLAATSRSATALGIVEPACGPKLGAQERPCCSSAGLLPVVSRAGTTG